MNITFHKWDKKNVKPLSSSCSNLLNINEIQFYQPYYSLYFNIYNTKKSHQRIDLKRRYYVHEILRKEVNKW